MQESHRAPSGLSLRRRLFLCLLPVATVLPVAAAAYLLAAPATKVTRGPDQLEPLEHRLRNLSLTADGVVVGSRGRDLYRIVGDGDVELWADFPAVIQGVHATASGAFLVATDDGPRDPGKPCTIYRAAGADSPWQSVLTLDTATALKWSLASAADGALFVGEYGPQQTGMAYRVFRSLDDGESWEVVFRAPQRDGVHIHRVAVDPFSGDVWVTVGDGKENRGAWRSRDGGDTFERVLDSQATGVAFTRDAVYWGEDHRKEGRITRLDRRTGRVAEVLHASRHGPFGGSIYDMTATADGTVYAATMKYASQPFTATLWRGRERSWELLAELPSGPDGAVAVETIAGPDRDGWIHLPGYRYRDEPVVR